MRHLVVGYSMNTAVIDANDTTHNAIANYYGDGGIRYILEELIK